MQARTTFAEFDEDGDGKLSTSELARLCHQMGSKLTHNELQAAVLTLDVNRDGYIQVRVCFWGLFVCLFGGMGLLGRGGIGGHSMFAVTDRPETIYARTQINRRRSSCGGGGYVLFSPNENACHDMYANIDHKTLNPTP